jgi:hypothetical protein
MAQEADVAGGASEAKVMGQDVRLFHDIEIGVEDDYAVQRNFDAAPVGDNFLVVPLAKKQNLHLTTANCSKLGMGIWSGRMELT